MPFFGLKDVEAALRRVGEVLAESVEAFVFGGGAMAAWGVKPATRDLDIAFREPWQRNAFGGALVALKATRPPDRHKPREGAREFYQTPDGMGWDLFLDNVIGFPLVADDFRDAEPWFHEKRLDVRRLRPELVFIMKAFTPRTRDISDMYELLQTGLVGPDSIAATVRRRIGDDPTQPWIAHFFQGVLDMAHDRDVRVDWIDEFEDAAMRSLQLYRDSDAGADG